MAVETNQSNWTPLATIIVALVGSITTIIVTLINVSKASSVEANKKSVDSTAQRIERKYPIADSGKLGQKSRPFDLTNNIIEGIPIGTIIASPSNYSKLLTLLSSGKRLDPAKTIWAPCDGRDVTGSAFAKYINSNTPDLRGQFLRGFNKFYSNDTPAIINGADPDDRYTKNDYSYQKQDVGKHEHPINDPGHTHQVEGLGKAGAPPAKNDAGIRVCCNVGPAYNLTAKLTYTGITRAEQNDGKETRPNNMAVYYYIKIN